MHRRIMVTGGAGFIGANFLNMMFQRYPDYYFLNVDALTYAGRLDNIEFSTNGVSVKDRYDFIEADICDKSLMEWCVERYEIDSIINFAAESHVSRSIHLSNPFILTNVVGTHNLLEIARQEWEKGKSFRFHQISTDEVYGDAFGQDPFTELSNYNPGTQYAASKAAADMLVLCYHNVYGLNAIVTNCTNNYGPYQHCEKFIPYVIKCIKNGKPITLHGDGKHIRDWLHVDDHCEAVDRLFHIAAPGERYNISANTAMTNLEVVQAISRVYEAITGKTNIMDTLEYIPDRKGNDKEYSINSNKMRRLLNWSPDWSFDIGIERTVAWYLRNEGWL